MGRKKANYPKVAGLSNNCNHNTWLILYPRTIHLHPREQSFLRGPGFRVWTHSNWDAHIDEAHPSPAEELLKWLMLLSLHILSLVFRLRKGKYCDSRHLKLEKVKKQNYFKMKGRPEFIKSKDQVEIWWAWPAEQQFPGEGILYLFYISLSAPSLILFAPHKNCAGNISNWHSDWEGNVIQLQLCKSWPQTNLKLQWF